jgi:hypothetical protein
MKIETLNIPFNNETASLVTFSASFDDVPNVSAIAVNQDIEIFVSSLTKFGCTINTSAPFTGNVKVIAIRG